MTLTRILFLSLAITIPTSWSFVAQATEEGTTKEAAGETTTKTTKKSKKSKKAEGAGDTKTETETKTTETK